MNKPVNEEVARDILEYDLDDTTTIREVKEDFIEMMLEHDVKKFSKNEGSWSGNLPEWTTFQQLFLEQVKHELLMELISITPSSYDGQFVREEKTAKNE